MTATVEFKTYDPDELTESWGTYNGLRLTRVGEDDDILILGHHDDETAWAAWAAYAREYNGLDDDAGHPSESYDLIPSYATFSDHSEECELVACSCADQACPACRRGAHGECEGSPACECPDWDHERDWAAQCTSCECYCDEYAWWVAEVKNGHPVMWVRWSYPKARARREAQRAEATR